MVRTSCLGIKIGANSLEVLEEELAWFILLTLTNIYNVEILGFEALRILPSASGSGGSRHSSASSSWSGSCWETSGQREWSASEGSQQSRPSRKNAINSGNIGNIHLLLDNVSEI